MLLGNSGAGCEASRTSDQRYSMRPTLAIEYSITKLTLLGGGHGTTDRIQQR